MKRPLMLPALLLSLGLTALPALATQIHPAPATLHLVCIPPTACTSGATTLVTTDATLNLDLVSEGGAISGEAFLGILVPSGTASFNVSLGALETNITFSARELGGSLNLNEPGLKAGYEFSALASASLQAGLKATNFTAYDWNLGTYGSSGKGGAGIPVFEVGPLPAGSVVVAWVVNSSGAAIERTPLSESVTIASSPSPVPEAGSLILFGIGLLALGAKLRWRRRG